MTIVGRAARRGLRYAIVVALIAASVTGGETVVLDKMRVRIALPEPVRTFIEGNGVPLRPRQRLAGYNIDPDKSTDTSPFTLEGLIAVTFVDGAQGFTLPPGRALVVSQQAGVVQDFTMTLFDEAKPFEETRRFLKDFIDEVDQKDWHAVGGITIPAHPGDLDPSGAWTSVCQMKDRKGNQLEVTMADHGLAPKQESWITVPLGRSDKASHAYLVQVSVYLPSGTSRSYGEDVYPRRLFVNGNLKAELPLRAWLDEPGWSPAAHGMVPVPQGERKGDVSFWRMPR